MSDISKDLKEQPTFQDELGSKDQDHHVFEIEKHIMTIVQNNEKANQVNS